jgi:hypothetical protein
MGLVEIIGGDHVPPHPFMVVNRNGCHVDLSDVSHTLFDPNTVSKVIWGFFEQPYHPNGSPAGEPKLAGRIEFKNGEVRKFYDANLMVPYMEAYARAQAKHAELARGAEAE